MKVFGRGEPQAQENQPPARNATPIYEMVKCGKNDELEMPLHCGMCGATWTGHWDDMPRNGIRRAKYEGGVWIWRDAHGYTFALRCRCTAGIQNYPSLKVVTDKMLALSQAQGTPGLAQSPEWFTRKASGEPAFVMSKPRIGGRLED